MLYFNADKLKSFFSVIIYMDPPNKIVLSCLAIHEMQLTQKSLLTIVIKRRTLALPGYITPVLCPFTLSFQCRVELRSHHKSAEAVVCNKKMFYCT